MLKYLMGESRKMICDKCGYNLTTGLRCPNCYHDNKDTDYTPDEIVYFVDGGMAAVDGKDAIKTSPGDEAPPETDVPLHCISPDLIAHARFARRYSVIFFIAGLFCMALLTVMFMAKKQSLKIMLSICISICVFFLLDIILSSFIIHGKEWMLAAYIPFAILSFPLIAISDILFLRTFYRSGILLSSRFFIKDFKNYLQYRREKKERQGIE